MGSLLESLNSVSTFQMSAHDHKLALVVESETNPNYFAERSMRAQRFNQKHGQLPTLNKSADLKFQNF